MNSIESTKSSELLKEHSSNGCPLCGAVASTPSWLGATVYRHRRYNYVECQSCHSLYCRPMPSADILAEMYGLEYGAGDHALIEVDDPKESLRVLDCLRRRQPGTFVDYGCGPGKLLAEARRLGWEAVGYEIDMNVANQAQRQTGAAVLTDFTWLAARYQADIIHVGDVLEHLTDLDRQMPEILSALKPDGLLVAQGPLEANANLFTSVLRYWRLLTSKKTSEFPPYHVSLATSVGQKRLFNRFGLSELQFSISEVSWPAPSRLKRANVMNIRTSGLFVLRELSSRISALRPSHWGNRYFYIGCQQAHT